VRIGIVTHKLLKGDGQARVNYELVKELQRRGHQVTLFSSSVTPELLDHAGTSWIPVPVKGWPSQLLKNLVFSVVSTARLLPRRRELDLLMVNGFITWVKSDVNAVHYVHGSWLRSKAHPFHQRRNASGWYQLLFTGVNALLEKVAFARTDYLVPVSAKVKDEIEAMGFRRPESTRVISNGVDTDEFTPLRRVSRAQLGLPEQVPLALFAGDIKSSRKNLDSVLRAMTDVPGLHLAVAGRTKGSPFPQLAAELGLKERVHFLDFRRDMADLMNNADFFVFPSRYEACTLAVIEALASGLPVITTYQSGVSELVDTAPSAGIVLEDAEDVRGLREAMRLLTEDAALRERMGGQARSIAERQRWESVAGKYIELFEELHGNKTAGQAAAKGEWVELYERGR
jgi:glycosyltransferase involved in cell wall biosynthesis